MIGFPVGENATADKPQSKAWHHDGSWWCILHDGRAGSYFYRLQHGTWAKGHMIYSGGPARADVLNDSSELYVLLWTAEKAEVFEFHYSDENGSYHLMEGFPVTLNLLQGHETAVLAKDSRGVLWVTYESQGAVYVSRSVTGLQWQENRVLGSSLADDDISSIIAFDHGIGVFWSNQNLESLHFRVRRDSQPLESWEEEEVVSQGGLVADDHVNLAVAPGWVYSVTKTSVDDSNGEVDGPTQAQVILSARSERGVWRTYDVAPLSVETVTRPIVVVDDENREAYVFYRKGDEIVYKCTSLDEIKFASEPVQAITVPGVILNNVTSCKQSINSSTGLLILATGDDGRAYHRLLPIR